LSRLSFRPTGPVCLAGPTASGKTAVALALTHALQQELPQELQRGPQQEGQPEPLLEIISMDSALVYRGMDVGTAKPSAQERAAVPHHLIDLLDPTEVYSAAAFAADATRLTADILARGRLPLLVGGTMLYFKALTEGLAPLPAADAALRAELESRAARLGWPALHAELAQVDPATAARLAPGDAQRIQRALEVWQASGVPLSQWHERAQQGAPGAAHRPRWAGMPVVSLEPTGEGGRAWLHGRIAQRFDAMLAAGLLDEVRALRQRGDLHAGLPAMRCVGYRQAWAALDAGDLGPLRDTGIAATRQLAKRQLTWLRSVPQRRVVPADAPDATAQAVAALRAAAFGA
jgi:tRNA dimethylallyltransferase